MVLLLSTLIPIVTLPALRYDLSRIDHVIVGVSDLRKGIDEFERMTGIRPIFGGIHPGRGTQNGLVSLGNHQYLEILAPNPDETLPPANDYLRQFSSLKGAGWAVRSDDLVLLQQTLQGEHIETAEIRPGARNNPGGVRLAWKSMSYAVADRRLPFFIQWDPTAVHPSTTSPGGCKLTALRLEGRDVDRLKTALKAAGLQIEVRDAKDASIRISLTCPKGTVEF
jgi:hypothetical protein